MKKELEILKTFIYKINRTNSTKEKIKILKEYLNNDFIAKIYVYTLSPYIQFFVTSATIKKNAEIIAKTNRYNSLFDLLDDLSRRTITGHEAIAAINAFIKDNSEYSDIILNIIDKNLKTRVDAAIINKVKPNLIPVFTVALAHVYDETTKKKVNWKDGWFVSRKLDGNRCIVIVNSDSSIEIKSRNGKDILTLDKVKEEIKKLNVRSVVFDGEICLVDQNGNEDFQGIMSEIRRKNHTIENPKYKIFDVIDLDEFINLQGNTPFLERQKRLKNILSTYNGTILDIVEQTLINNEAELEQWLDIACKNKWEGVMLRKNTGYKADRSFDLLKVKKFRDSEYIVEKAEMGPMRVIVDGVEVEEVMLKNIIIKHKGFEVAVGSGFSLEERRKYFKNPELLIGKEVTVQYFEETKNLTGGISLRFPTVKHIWTNGRRTDVE